MALLEVKNLKVFYHKKKSIFKAESILRAVNDVSFTLEKDEIIGLVGESGCGKSTLGRALLKLEDTESGSIRIDGTDLQSLSGQKLRKFRKNIQMIFQDPYSSLNPRLTVQSALDEVLQLHTALDESWREKRIDELLTLVGIPLSAKKRYPHQFSGGQRQRIGIARALAAQPKIIVADEPVSALDVSVQSSIINLLSDIKKRNHTAFLFIAHDLGVVEHISDKIMVMYLGKIVESGSSHDVCSNPQHPYTRALLSAVPDLGVKNQKRLMLTGDVPSPYQEIKGCPFHPRCPMVKPACSQHEIMLLSSDGTDHLSSCLFPEEVKNL